MNYSCNVHNSMGLRPILVMNKYGNIRCLAEKMDIHRQ
jgi:hypothetical protein